MLSRIGAAALAAALVPVAGCDETRAVSSDAASAGSCTTCHGGVDDQSGAPPRDLAGNVDRSFPTVGAHTPHLAASRFSLPVPCVACHVVPATVSSPGHGDNAVEVPFGPLAAAGGVTPSWDASGATCTVACHGANLEGATNPAPSWTGGDAEVSCGSCHGLPPNDGGDSTGQNGHDSHVRGRGMSCGQCHAGYSSTAVVKATHVDGVRDVAFGYAAPDPALYATDPVTACTAAPVTLTATLTSGWDCTECHALRYVWIDDCCGYVPANPWCQP